MPTTATEIAPSPSRPKQHLLLSLSLSLFLFLLPPLSVSCIPAPRRAQDRGGGGGRADLSQEDFLFASSRALHSGGKRRRGEERRVEPRFWQKEKKGEGETSHTSSSLSGLPLIMRSPLLFFLRECEHCIVYERNEPSFQSRLAIWHRAGGRGKGVCCLWRRAFKQSGFLKGHSPHFNSVRARNSLRRGEKH